MACDRTMGWERQDRRVFPLQCSHGVPNNSKSSQAQNSKTQISPTKEAKKSCARIPRFLGNATTDMHTSFDPCRERPHFPCKLQTLDWPHIHVHSLTPRRD